MLDLLQTHQAVTCPDGAGADPDEDVEVELDIGALSAAAQQDLYSLYKKVHKQSAKSGGAVPWDRPFDDSSESGHSEDE